MAVIRRAALSDCEELSKLLEALWPEASAREHASEILPILAGNPPGMLPVVFFVADADGALLAFIEIGLRSHADGCDTRQPVGFVEGWFVREAYRRTGIGTRLMAAAEDWARRQSCVEMASDTWADHRVSQEAHQALHFEVVDVCVHYRKAL